MTRNQIFFSLGSKQKVVSTTALREFHGEEVIRPTKKPTKMPIIKPTKKPRRSAQPTPAPSAAPSQEPPAEFVSYSRRPHNREIYFHSTNPTVV